MIIPPAVINVGPFRRKRSKNDPDSPLNLAVDQAKTIKRRLRQLKMQEAGKLAVISSPLLLLGAGVGLMIKRRFLLGSMAVAGFFVEKALAGRRFLDQRRELEDLRLERRALKAERGDLGKLEVIPFR